MIEPFAYTSGPLSAKTMLIGEAWGEDEERYKLPFVGYSGKELFRILGEAMPDLNPKDHAFVCSAMNSTLWQSERKSWLEDASIILTNVFNSRPSDNKIEAYLGKADTAMPGMPAYKQGNFFRAEFVHHLERLWKEINHVKPNLIVCLGNTPAWAVIGNSGITALRGTVAASVTPEGFKVLPAFHPAHIMRNWAARPILIADMMKARRESQFPEIRRPRRQILVKPTVFEIQDWLAKNWGDKLMAVDIETKMGQITDIGFATSRGFAIVITFIDPKLPPPYRYWENESDEIFVWSLVKTILEGPNPKIFQNGLYDLQYLARMGIRPKNCTHDTMLLSHSLFPEIQKSLGFLGSIYTDEAAWKLMRHNKEELKKDE